MLKSTDTNVMIWGLKCVCTPGQEPMLAKARELLSQLDATGERLALPAQVVAELLVGSDESQMASELAVLESQFIVLPFDTKAALIAAKLKNDKGYMRALRDSGRTRACINADVNIVATARAHGVAQLYTEDDDMRDMAERCGLVALSLPEPRAAQQAEQRGRRRLFNPEAFDPS